MNIDLIDCQYQFEFGENDNEIIIGCSSKTANLSTWLRVTDDMIKNGGFASIIPYLKGMPDALAYNYNLKLQEK